jgi:hypothetical protein
VRDGRRARLLRVVDEVALRPAVGLLADDLDGALVGADRAVRAETVEDGTHRVRLVERERRIDVEARLRDVVGDAEGEAPARRRPRELVERRLHHGGREFLRAEAVAAADDTDRAIALRDRRDDVEVERLADAPGLLRPIERRNRAHRRR